MRKTSAALRETYSLFCEEHILTVMTENEIATMIVEIKSIETLAPVHHKQLLTYLRLTGMKLGLLINFNEALMKNGIHQIVNNL